eukprot:TRINITY_DN11865_c1_g5_i4.p3 TRINITY_DN11865_c1_g5~~TRINITY_DN11865_c1_g5_i4.p3  ORF type:complete len:107 (+),score=13.22 TRINITY_DN11865_c1_g5_i4:577-897(+)
MIHLWQRENAFMDTLRLGLLVAVVACASISTMAAIDYHFYGEWTLPLLNFLDFNLFTSQADVFGTHPWHWMFTAASPQLAELDMIYMLDHDGRGAACRPFPSCAEG